MKNTTKINQKDQRLIDAKNKHLTRSSNINNAFRLNRELKGKEQ